MRIPLLPALILFCSVCHAQQVRQVECRFLAFGANAAATEALAVDDKGAETKIPLPTTKLSAKVVTQAKDGKIPFLSATDRKPMATATIPAGVNAALIIFVRQPAKAGAPAADVTWRTFVVEDSPKNFPDGGAYVANFSPGDIRFAIGDHRGQLAAGKSQGYAMPKDRDTFNMAPVVFEFKNGQNWRVGNESSLRFLPGTRYLLFAYLDPASNRPKIHTCQDMAAPPVEAPAVP